MVPITCSGRSAASACMNFAPGVMRAGGPRPSREMRAGPSRPPRTPCRGSRFSSCDQVFDSLAFLVQFLQGGVHALAAELRHLDAFHDLVLATLAGHGV